MQEGPNPVHHRSYMTTYDGSMEQSRIGEPWRPTANMDCNSNKRQLGYTSSDDPRRFQGVIDIDIGLPS